LRECGSPDIDRSQPYLVTARQLPLRPKDDQRSRVQVVSASGAILNVAPLCGCAELRLLSSAPARTPAGGPALSILVENPTSSQSGPLAADRRGQSFTLGRIVPTHGLR